MKKVLITGAGSYVGTNIENWLKKDPEHFEVETVGTMHDEWKDVDFSKFDAVFHVAGIAHVNAKKSMEPLYYKVNRDLTVEIAKHAKACGVRQFIFMSSMIVYHESKRLQADIVTKDTVPAPNGFYGDSKLQAELGLQVLEDESFRVCIVRPPMIYGPNCKGNFMRLAKLGTVTPIFPAFHCERSMLYIDNLAEFIKQAIARELRGIYFPQNKEFVDTVHVAEVFAKQNNHKLHVWKWLNIFVYMGSPFIQALNKMFATYYYEQDMSEYDFEYRVVGTEESFARIDISGASLTKMQ